MNDSVKINYCFYPDYTKSLGYKIFLKKKSSKTLRNNERSYLSLKINLSYLERFFIYTGQLISDPRLKIKCLNMVKLSIIKMLLVYNWGNDFQKKLKSHEKINKPLNFIDFGIVTCENNFKNIEFYSIPQIKCWGWAFFGNFIQNSFLFFQKNKLFEYFEKFNFKIKQLSFKSTKNTSFLFILNFTQPIFIRPQNYMYSSQYRTFYTSNKLIFKLGPSLNKDESVFIQFSFFTNFSEIRPWVIINETLEFFFYQILKKFITVKKSVIIEKLRFTFTFFKFFVSYRTTFCLKANQFKNFFVERSKLTFEHKKSGLFWEKNLTDSKIYIFFNKKLSSHENYIVLPASKNTKQEVKDFIQTNYLLKIKKFYVNINWINDMFLNIFFKNIHTDYLIFKVDQNKKRKIFIESLLFSSLFKNKFFSKCFIYFQKKSKTSSQISFIILYYIFFGIQNFYEIQILF